MESAVMLEEKQLKPPSFNEITAEPGRGFLESLPRIAFTRQFAGVIQLTQPVVCGDDAGFSFLEIFTIYAQVIDVR